MAERYNPNKGMKGAMEPRKRRETTFGGLDALNQPTQQDTPFFGLEGREQLQGVNRPTTAPSIRSQPSLLQRESTARVEKAYDKDFPAGEPVKLDPITGGGHPGAMNVVGSAYDAKFGPTFSSDPGKGRPLPTPPLAKRPWQEDRPSPKPTNGIVGGATPYKPKSRADDKLRSSILKDYANEAEQEALDSFGYPLAPTAPTAPTARRARPNILDTVRGAIFGSPVNAYLRHGEGRGGKTRLRPDLPW